MNKEEVSNRLESVFKEAIGEYSKDTKFQDLELDSMDLMEMIANIEDEFDISINSSSIVEFISIDDILNYLSEKLP